MSNQFNHYLKRAKGVGMTSEEKERIFSDLNERVSATPEGTPSFLQYHLSGYSFQFSRAQVSVFAVLVLLILTTGTSFAAGGALPGDLLYPVKINLNEKVLGYIAERNGTKQDFEVMAALSRLQEAEQLQTEGRLDETSKKTIEVNFQEHAANIHSDDLIGISSAVSISNATSTAQDTQKTPKEKMLTRFQTELKSHRDTLMKLSDTSTEDSKPNLSSLIMTVDNEINFKPKDDTATSTATSTGSKATTTPETSIDVKTEASSTANVFENIRPHSEDPPPTKDNPNTNSKSHASADVHQNVGNVMTPLHLNLH